jgi:hypothetical protein
MGSLRCHDCRDDHVALRIDLVEQVRVEEEHRAA